MRRPLLTTSVAIAKKSSHCNTAAIRDVVVALDSLLVTVDEPDLDALDMSSLYCGRLDVLIGDTWTGLGFFESDFRHADTNGRNFLNFCFAIENQKKTKTKTKKNNLRSDQICTIFNFLNSVDTSSMDTVLQVQFI